MSTRVSLHRCIPSHQRKVDPQPSPYASSGLFLLSRFFVYSIGTEYYRRILDRRFTELKNAELMFLSCLIWISWDIRENEAALAVLPDLLSELDSKTPVCKNLPPSTCLPCIVDN